MGKRVIRKSARQATSQVVQVPSKALPVTLLSGFLGSGKTTLLRHILRSDHGLRIAVIVNDIGAINVDAALIKQTHHIVKTDEKVVALQNGCICCTLRGDLLEELVRLAELEDFDYVIVESSGISEPEQVAETFDSRLAEQIHTLGDQAEGLDASMLKVLNRLKEAGGLQSFAKLDCTVTVVDAFTMFHDFETSDLLSARRNDVVPEDERTVSDLMVDQIEFADVIVLNKLDMIDQQTKVRVLDLVRKLNHRAKIIESTHGRIDVAQIVNTGLFDLEKAQTGYGWLQDLHEMTLREVNGRKTVTPKPETEEYGVRNFVYVQRRPFHPLRLFQLLHDKFILQLEPFQEDEGEDEEDEDGTEMEEDENENDNDNGEDEEDEEMADAVDSMTSRGQVKRDPALRTACDSPLSSSTSDRSDPPTTATSVASSDADMADAKGHNLPAAPEMPDNATILATKCAHPLFGRLFRSKGEFWLATRPWRAGEWSQAGAMLTLQGGRPWFVTLPEEEYLTGNEDIDALVQHDLALGGEWGDRRQEVVFIGVELDTKGVTAVLDECLLNDDEWVAWVDIMRSDISEVDKDVKLANVFDDGFPDWHEEGDEEGHEGHDHSVIKVKPKVLVS